MLVVWIRVLELLGPASLGRRMGLDQVSLWLCIGAPDQRLAFDLAPCGITRTCSSTLREARRRNVIEAI